MGQESKKKSPEDSEEKTDDSGKTDQTKKDEISRDKPWKLAPRTGQRHANPFQRKTN